MIYFSTTVIYSVFVLIYYHTCSLFIQFWTFLNLVGGLCLMVSMLASGAIDRIFYWIGLSSITIQNIQGYGVQRYFQQYFSYIMAVSFIGGGNRSTRRKPPTYRTSPINFITYKLYCCIKYTSPWAGFELTTLVVIGTDCKGSCKSNYNTIYIHNHKTTREVI